MASLVLAVSLSLMALPGHAAAADHLRTQTTTVASQETAPRDSVSPRRVDQDFAVYSAKAMTRIAGGLFAPPTTSAQTAKEGLRGRAFYAAATCWSAIAVVSSRIPSGTGWFAILKLMRAAAVGRSISRAFEFSKLLSMKYLESSVIAEILDVIGVHHCGELRMWVNMLINSARSLQENGKTHMSLHVYGTDYFTGLKVMTCEVQPWWGPDIDNMNRLEGTYYLDDWNGAGDAVTDACPTPDDWNVPLKTYALLWQESPI